MEKKRVVATFSDGSKFIRGIGKDKFTHAFAITWTDGIKFVRFATSEKKAMQRGQERLKAAIRSHPSASLEVVHTLPFYEVTAGQKLYERWQALQLKVNNSSTDEWDFLEVGDQEVWNRLADKRAPG